MASEQQIDSSSRAALNASAVHLDIHNRDPENINEHLRVGTQLGLCFFSILNIFAKFPRSRWYAGIFSQRRGANFLAEGKVAWRLKFKNFFL